MVTQIEYDEFGTLRNPENVPANGNIFSYTGHIYDESTELYYAKARYYDSKQGRMISLDPISYGLNDYIYCSNIPIKYVDPSGMMSAVIEVAPKIGEFIAKFGDKVIRVVKAGAKTVVAGEWILYDFLGISESNDTSDHPVPDHAPHPTPAPPSRENDKNEGKGETKNVPNNLGELGENAKHHILLVQQCINI